MEECPNCGSNAFDGTTCASCGYDSYESVTFSNKNLDMESFKSLGDVPIELLVPDQLNDLLELEEE